MTRQLVDGLDLMLIGGRFLIKSYSTDKYDRRGQVSAVRKAEKAAEYILDLLRYPKIKVELYHWRRGYGSLSLTAPYRKKKWIKIAEVSS